MPLSEGAHTQRGEVFHFLAFLGFLGISSGGADTERTESDSAVGVPPRGIPKFLVFGSFLGFLWINRRGAPTRRNGEQNLMHLSRGAPTRKPYFLIAKKGDPGGGIY